MCELMSVNTDYSSFQIYKQLRIATISNYKLAFKTVPSQFPLSQ